LIPSSTPLDLSSLEKFKIQDLFSAYDDKAFLRFHILEFQSI